MDYRIVHKYLNKRFYWDATEQVLRYVTPEGLINVTPVAEGTDAEISEEDALRGYSISSEAVSMSEVDSRVAANGVNLEWLEDCGQYYAEYQYDGKTYKIWVEDQKSIGEKLNVMKENHLAGASFWKLGYEKNTIWDTIAEAMQQ